MDANTARAAQLFLAHHGFVKGLALKHAPLPGLAEDILQQVLVEFLTKAEQWDLGSDVRPLLATMTRNVALRHWRERTRELPEVMRKLAEHVRQLAEERDAEPRYDDEVTALRGCLEKLPEKSRALIDLYYYRDVPTAEIAAQMDMKTDTVCRAMCRVREKLRACVGRVLNGGPAYV
jgi:RNA polymerase sigma-70 factor (ECF subfamily)